MRSQSALPLKKSCAVRPCTVSAAAPADSIVVAISMAVMLFRVRPRRIFAVTGVGWQALTTRSTICPTRFGSHSKYDPLWARSLTSFTGQPKLISTTLTLYSLASRAPTAASVSGSLSHICTASGRGSSATPHSRSGASGSSFLPIHTKPRGNHFSGLQTDAAEFTHHLAIGVVGEAGHRSLQQRRIDDQRADAQRPHRRRGNRRRITLIVAGDHGRNAHVCYLTGRRVDDERPRRTKYQFEGIR